MIKYIIRFKDGREVDIHSEDVCKVSDLWVFSTSGDTVAVIKDSEMVFMLKSVIIECKPQESEYGRSHW